MHFSPPSLRNSYLLTTEPSAQPSYLLSLTMPPLSIPSFPLTSVLPQPIPMTQPISRVLHVQAPSNALIIMSGIYSFLNFEAITPNPTIPNPSSWDYYPTDATILPSSFYFPHSFCLLMSITFHLLFLFRTLNTHSIPFITKYSHSASVFSKPS